MQNTQNIQNFEMNTNRRQKNFFENFDLWGAVHYYAFKSRWTYPNLFFFYFNYEGIVDEEFQTKALAPILTTLRDSKIKTDGMWGYLSLLVKRKNGIKLNEFLSKTEYYNHANSTPCDQDALPDFSSEIKVIFNYFLNNLNFLTLEKS
jgi:hypothetical protein